MNEPESKFIPVHDLNLHYLDWGNPQATPMLLIHGLCGNAHYWDFFAPRLRDEYHILAIDQRGHGDSSHANNYGTRYYNGDLEAFVDELKLSDFMLIGHSMGGINAILYAERHPDKVVKLVIVDIGPEIGNAGAERMRMEMENEPETFDSVEEDRKSVV